MAVDFKVGIDWSSFQKMEPGTAALGFRTRVAGLRDRTFGLGFSG
jgi:hypothetical protein